MDDYRDLEGLTSTKMISGAAFAISDLDAVKTWSENKCLRLLQFIKCTFQSRKSVDQLST